MSALPLHEAVLLGRMLIEKPTAYDIDNCAIGMVCKAHGLTPASCNGYNPVLLLYPWLEKIYRCAWCERPGPEYGFFHPVDSFCLRGGSVLAHPFDHHVMTNEITLEEFCEWLRLLEQEETGRRTVNAQMVAGETHLCQ